MASRHFKALFVFFFLLFSRGITRDVAERTPSDNTKSCPNVVLESTSNLKHNPVLYLGFENVKEFHNWKRSRREIARIRLVNNVQFFDSDKCGKAANLTEGHIEIRPGRHQWIFQGFTLAMLVKPDSVSNKQCLFRLLGRDKSRCRLEIFDGGVNWKCWRRRKKVFSISTKKGVISPHIWTHVTATFTTGSRDASIYINGEKITGGVTMEMLPAMWVRKFEIGTSRLRHQGVRGAVDELYIYTSVMLPSRVTKLANNGRHLTKPNSHEDMYGVSFSTDGRKDEEQSKEYRLRCYVCKAYNQSSPRHYCSPGGVHTITTVCHGVTPLKCIEHSGIDDGTRFFIRDCKEETFCEARSCTGDMCTMKCCGWDLCNDSARVDISVALLSLMVLIISTLS